MPLIDHLLSSPRVRQLLWKFWYPYLTRKLRGEKVVFLNYAFETRPPLAVPLSADDETNRPWIQLYHHVASQAPLRGKHVLEVSCGHGGGASYLARTFEPARYVALDLNPAAIAFCRATHRVAGLEFVRGHAEALPFPDESFDVVVNVEASHCYPSLAHFLREVARVLRPGGRFLYADFRFASAIAEWEADLATSPLAMQAMQPINAEVIRGLDLNSERSERLITSRLPRFLHSLGRDFAAVKGSRVYQAIKEGGVAYRSYDFEKPSAPAISGKR